MKVREIRDLIDFISNSGLDEVNIETEEFKISVKKNSPSTPTVSENPGATVIIPEAPRVVTAATTAPAAPAPKETSEANEDNNYIEIKSPMIGTFYNTPSPDAEEFVKVGDTVKVGQTVCIVEAMKLFNEIESEYSGKIVKTLVENASPVEFDQPLFLIDPS